MTVQTIFRPLAALVLAAALFTGCAQSAAPTGGRSMADREGTTFTVPAKLERIISTAPSNTEELVGLGLADRLVAIDTYSADVEGVAAEVPQISFRQPDVEAIVALEPDIIIASGHNRAGGDDPFALLKEAGICVVYVPSSESIEGICGDIAFLAELFGRQEAGDAMIGDFKKQVEEIRAIGASIPQEERRSVYFEIAPAPDLYTFGKNTFQGEFLELIGADNIFGDEEGWMSPNAEAVVERNPDVILTNVSYVENAVGEILSREGWDAVKAVADGAVYQIEANPSSRPSQLSIRALRQMARAVYPEWYDFAD